MKDGQIVWKEKSLQLEFFDLKIILICTSPLRLVVYILRDISEVVKHLYKPKSWS